MIQKPSIDNLIEDIENSGKRDKLCGYIEETADKCVKLCCKGENVRIIYEYAILIDNLRNFVNIIKCKRSGEKFVRQQPFYDNSIAKLIENIEKSDKRDKIYDYIREVAVNCENFCRKGENVKVISEYALMIENLRKNYLKGI